MASVCGAALTVFVDHQAFVLPDLADFVSSWGRRRIAFRKTRPTDLGLVPALSLGRVWLKLNTAPIAVLKNAAVRLLAFLLEAQWTWACHPGEDILRMRHDISDS